MNKERSALGRKIVTVGGGSGGSVLHRGLVNYSVSLTAICTVFDSGGSTGVLRDIFGTLPSGDIRRCLVALADPEDGDTLRQLFTFRFRSNGKEHGLNDQSLGNLIMTAAEELWGRGAGLERISKLLNIRGTVAPVSPGMAHLCAELSDGTLLESESAIDTRDPHDERSIAKVFLTPKATISREAVEALEDADVIVFGPGDLFTSIIPNLLVDGFAEAVSRSSAKLVYVANLMTKGSETKGYSLEAFVNTMITYGVGRDVFHTVIVNKTLPPQHVLTKYLNEDCAEPVLLTDLGRNELRHRTQSFMEVDLLDESGLIGSSPLIRHDPYKLAQAIMSV